MIDYFIYQMTSKCDNDGCIGGRAYRTDESVELDPTKLFCSEECADKYVLSVYKKIESITKPKEVDLDIPKHLENYLDSLWEDGFAWCDGAPPAKSETDEYHGIYLYRKTDW